MTFIKVKDAETILTGRYGQTFEQLSADEKVAYFSKVVNILKLKNHVLLNEKEWSPEKTYYDEFFMYLRAPNNAKNTLFIVPLDIIRYVMVTKVSNDLWALYRENNIDQCDRERPGTMLFGLLHMLNMACTKLGIRVPIYLYNYDLKAFYTPVLLDDTVKFMTKNTKLELIDDDDRLTQYNFVKTDIQNYYQFFSTDTITMEFLDGIKGMVLESTWVGPLMNVMTRKLLNRTSQHKEDQMAVTIAREIYGIAQ